MAIIKYGAVRIAIAPYGLSATNQQQRILQRSKELFLKPIIKLIFILIVNASLPGCGGPAHKQGSYLAGEIGDVIFINHGCVNETKKNLEYCGDISVHFSAGWNTLTIVVDGSVNYQDIQDVLSFIKVEYLTTDLEIEFKQKKLAITFTKDE